MMMGRNGTAGTGLLSMFFCRSSRWQPPGYRLTVLGCETARAPCQTLRNAQGKQWSTLAGLGTYIYEGEGRYPSNKLV